MGSSTNLSKLVIPKHHWQENKEKSSYMNGSFKDSGLDSRGALKSKVHCWLAVLLCAGLVLIPFLMFIFAIDNMEAPTKRQPWLSLDGPRLEFIGVHSRWSFLRSGKTMSSDQEHVETRSRGALQGMGTLLRLGTRAMQELVVAHLTEDTTSEELRLFLRTLHRSGSTARADVVLLFPCSPMPVAMEKVIQEEEESFQKLLVKYRPEDTIEPQSETTTSTSPGSSDKILSPSSGRGSDQLLMICPGLELLTASGLSVPPFNALAFQRSDEDEQETAEILWGKRRGSLEADDVNSSSRWATWGSIVSFDVQELDPQDALHGFFDIPSVQLRRWICYDMLLGMIKSRYKNVLLTQVKGVYVLGDAFSAIRKKQTVYITTEDVVWRDAKREPVAERGPEESGHREQNVESLRSTVQDLPAARHESIRSLRENRKLKASEEAEGDEEAELVAARDEPSGLTGSSREGKIDVARLKTLGKKEGQKWRHAHGLIQSVYGTQVWNTFEESDKQNSVVSTAVIMGAVQFARGLANKMTSEIVRVAMERKSRRVFHDKAVLNMWIHKKSALGKRLSDHLKVVRNQDSVVHSLHGSQQPFVFWRKRLGYSRYLVVHQEHVQKDANVISDFGEELCKSDRNLYQKCL